MTVMDLSGVQAVIQSAKARGREPLERFIRQRLPEASDAQIEEAAEVAVEIIETVPIFLARAAQAAEERHLVPVVQPLLDHAAAYFIRPVDLIPEMTQGLAGLLDDTYLVLRILSNLEKGPEPFIDWDLDDPTNFIRGLVGEGVGRHLDLLSIRAMEEVSDQLTTFWTRFSAEA
jgi:uncharacterized membrane protein YkvA (DUF1232 family)